MTDIEDNMEGHTVATDDPSSLSTNSEKANLPPEPLSVQQEKALQAIEMIVGDSYPRSTIIRHLKNTNFNRPEDLVVTEVVNALFDSPIMEEDKKRSITPHPVHNTHDARNQTKDDLALPTMGPHNKDIADKEQTELQKAIEESLITSSAEKVSITSYLAALPENPEDMQRVNSFPCGMHNIGQSCWFSVVAQLLFSIRKYRYLIYDLVPHDNIQHNSLEVKFLLAIRVLFATMEKSNKKFINPLQALEVVNEISRKKDGRDVLNCQQDAMEMLLRLIDWIENAALTIEKGRADESKKIKDSDETMDCEESSSKNLASKNNMSIDDISRSDYHMDDQYIKCPGDATAPADDHPIKNIFLEKSIQRQVMENGYNVVSTDVSVLHLLNIRYDNLHDAFEDGCFQNSVENWVESAPKVMIFSLNRFHYDKVGGSTKVHKPFRFPEEFFIDRYLHSNATEIMSIREELNRMRYCLAVLRAQIEGLEQFPMPGEGQHCRLADAFDTTLSFLTRSAVLHNESSLNQTDLVSSKLPKSLPEPPLVPEIDKVLKTLRTIQEEIVAKETELNMQANDIESSINSIFERPELQKHRYQLHAIVIHEGEANMGHYWIYVRGENGQWQKMNDRTVEVATWSQIQKDAYGIELPNTSAYGLVYIAEGSDLQTETVNQLPSDLAAMVEKENATLLNDIKRHRMNQSRPSGMISTQLHLNPDSNLNDPGALHYSLDDNMHPLFAMEEKKAIKNKIDQLLLLLLRLYSPGFSFETATKHFLDQLFKSTGIEVLKDLISKDGDCDQPEAYFNQLDMEQCRKIYESFFTNWYAKSVGSDMRQNVLSFWKATGSPMHGKVSRYILVLSLARSNITQLSALAKQEMWEFEQQRSHADYTMYAQLQMGFYDVMRVSWACVSRSVSYLSLTDKPGMDYYNDFVNEWSNGLTHGVYCYHVNKIFYKEISSLVKQDIRRYDFEGFLTPLNTCKAIILLPLLNIFTFIVYAICQLDIENDEFQNLIVPQSNLINSAVIIVKTLAHEEGRTKEASCSFVLQRMISSLTDLIRLQRSEEFRCVMLDDLRRILTASLIDDSFPTMSLGVNWTNIIGDIETIKVKVEELEIDSEESAIRRYERMLESVDMMVNNAVSTLQN
ncbi:unnamed protein product [Auanema sp. JU1783]|nr:unnamed protein product [Auanema sp. JU1783]